MLKIGQLINNYIQEITIMNVLLIYETNSTNKFYKYKYLIIDRLEGDNNFHTKLNWVLA
jgi:hypothetical protein